MKLFFWGNVVAILIFSYLAVSSSLFTDLGVRMRFTALDRAGVINEEALKGFDPSFGFGEGHIRNSVPRFVAGPALENEMRNALAGACLAFMNAIIAGGVWLHDRRTNRDSEKQLSTTQSN